MSPGVSLRFVHHPSAEVRPETAKEGQNYYVKAGYFIRETKAYDSLGSCHSCTQRSIRASPDHRDFLNPIQTPSDGGRSVHRISQRKTAKLGQIILHRVIFAPVATVTYHGQQGNCCTCITNFGILLSAYLLTTILKSSICFSYECDEVVS
jgi:hypothetical protein